MSYVLLLFGSPDVGRQYDYDTDVITVDNGFYAGEWGDVDSCPSGSFAHGIRLSVSTYERLPLHSYICDHSLHYIVEQRRSDVSFT